MDKRSSIYIIIFGILFFICISVFSQQTVVYNEVNSEFKTGLELFQKQKYGSAQKIFTRIIRLHQNAPAHLLRIDAEYYSALCALELFNKDAELLLRNFVSDHPESPRAQAACFHLGKYAYRKRQYVKALNWFSKVDVYDLNNEELSEFYFKRGYSHLELDSTHLAQNDFFEIKDIDNKYAAPATYYFGHIAYLKKNYQTALIHFNRLKNNESFGPIVPYYIAQIYYLQNKYDSVIVFAEPLLDSSSRRVAELTKIIGSSYYRLAKYKESLPYLERYKNHTSKLNRNEWYELGYAYYKTENFNSALFCFQNTTEGEDSLSQNAYYHLADCYLRPGPYNGGPSSKMLARSSFERAYKLDFDSGITEDALFHFAKLSYELSFSPFNEAIMALNEYIKRYPKSPRLDECYKYLVNVYLSTRNYREAMNSIESIRVLNEEMKAAYQKIAYMRGTQLLADNKPVETIAYLNKSMRYPSNLSYLSLAQYWKGEAMYRLAEKDQSAKLFDSTMVSYRAFLSSQGAINHKEYFAAHYNLGYAHFKKAEYNEANSWFRKYVQLRSNEPKEKLNDAYLRVGDGFFMTRDYLNAGDYYAKALETGERDADYAMYQLALSQGLMSKPIAKAATLEKMLGKYGERSKYEAIARFELAKTYLQTGDDTKALSNYNKIVKDHPQSSFTGRSLLQAGLIQSRLKKYDDALATLDRVLGAYPKTTEAFEAISAMRDIYRAKGDMDSYEDKLKGIPYAAVSVASLDSSNFAVAFDHVEANDCDKAVEYFTKYITKFPDGIFIIDAYYHKADCEFKQKKYDIALSGLQTVIDKPFNKFTEKALLKASFINYQNKKYNNALIQYKRLALLAEYPQNAQEGKIGTMRCLWLMKTYNDAIPAAKEVLALDKIQANLKAEASLILARSAFETQDLDLATKHFIMVRDMAANERSAESKYYLALISYLKKDYKSSQKAVFDLINNDPGYNYWVGKSLILLSDNYAAQNDLFNARFALESLIEKSTITELVDEAKQRLERIVEAEERLEAEKAAQEKENTEPEIMYTPDNPKDSVLYKPE